MCWWWIWNADWGLGEVVVVEVKGRLAAEAELGVVAVMVAGKLEGFSVFLDVVMFF